jgi:arginyl-tRNA synthetase
MNATTKLTGIGAAVARKEDLRLVTGRGCFSDDFRAPGQLHAFFLRSPHAHARINSIFQQWGGQISDLASADLSLLQSKASDYLLRRLAEYPELLTEAAAELAPHALAFYLRDLAGDFHTFYNADRVLVDDQNLKAARLALLLATRQVLQNGLKVLGVSAPAKM